MRIGVKDMTRTAATRITASVAAVALLSGLGGCDVKEEIEKIGAVYTCDDFTVYPDSFVSPQLTIAPRGDSIMILRGDVMQMAAAVADTVDCVAVTGDDVLVNYLFNSGKGVIHPGYDALTPYEIYVSEALLNTDSAALIVDSRISSGEVAEYLRGAYRWPVVMADASWGIAASSVSWMIDDDARAKARMQALKRLVDNDLKYVFDRREGLFIGVPPEMDGHLIPGWANAADAAAMMTLEGNVARHYAMRCVNALLPDSYDGQSIDDLAKRISQLYWLPNLGMLSQTLYQRPYPIAVTAADNLAQAAAVVTGTVSDAMAAKMLSSTQLEAGRVPVTYPDQGLGHDSRRAALTAAMWAIASARAGNYDAWRLSYGSLVAMAVDSEYALRLLRGVTLRTLFGLDPAADGLHINPFVDESLGDYRRLSGFRYRDALLTVTVRGKGDVIASVTLDGEQLPQSVLPRDIKGQHDIEIMLSGSSGAPGGVTVGTIPTMPAPPEVIMDSQRKFEIKSPETSQFIVYLDGAVSELIERNSYDLYNAAPVTAISFEADVSNEVTGYSSRSYLYIPAADSLSIPCNAVAHTGGRVLAKKDLAAKHVESTRYKNARLTFRFRTDETGDYYLRLRYLDGLGVVNRNRQYALRLLCVNGRQEGVMVLPQRGPDRWSAAEDWAAMNGTTLPVAVTMEAGDNEITVEYFTPDGVRDFDHDSNTIIPIALEIIKQ
ncbi:MAG: hypothetical protein HDS77_00375 [Bacteroidales bacterium]|nr:hypothetical protein [Bacteroidales bacterium]MBD5258760.1 hypothetical protein [Barnesiella sp.]